MKFKSGRELPQRFDDIHGMGPDLKWTGGYNDEAAGDEIEQDFQPTPDERRELAEEMISRWKKWAGMGEAEDRKGIQDDR